QRRNPVIAKTTRADRRRHEVVAERMHRHEWGELARVAEVVGEHTPCQGWTGRWFARENVDLAPGDLLPQERKRQAGEIRAAADTADDEVGERARQLHLRQRLLPDHSLVQEHVVENAPERVGRVLPTGRVLDRLRDRNPETPGRVRVLVKEGAAA